MATRTSADPDQRALEPLSLSEPERTIQALSQVGQALASTPDYEHALAAVIEAVAQLLDAESGAYMKYNATTNELVGQTPTFGEWEAERIAQFRVSVTTNQGIVRAFTERRALIFNDLRAPVFRLAKLFNLRSGLAIPIIIGDRVLGTFHVTNKRDGGFTEADRDLLLKLAPLIAVGIESAELFREAREQRRQLERALQVQDHLSRAVFAAPDLQPLAEALARLVQRAVVVLDTDLRVLATAEAPGVAEPLGDVMESLACVLDQRPPARGEASLRVHVGNEPSVHRFVVIPIVVDERLDGYLAVDESGEPLDAVDTRALTHAATVLSLQMLRQRTAYEVERRLKGDLLQELFGGPYRDDRHAVDLMRRLGYRLDGPYRVARVDVVFPAAPTDHSRGMAAGEGSGPAHALQPRTFAALATTWAACFDQVPLAPWRTGGLAVLQATELDLPGQGARFYAALSQRADALPARARIYLAFGSPVETVRDLALSLRHAESALATARELHIADRPVQYEEFGVHRVLLVSPTSLADQTEFIRSTLGPVLEHDAAHASGLLETLATYVAADYLLAPAAERLFVHPNTLKYRLKQIRRLLGGDVTRGELRFQVELALKLMELHRLASRTAGEPRSSTGL